MCEIKTKIFGTKDFEDFEINLNLKMEITANFIYTKNSLIEIQEKILEAIKEIPNCEMVDIKSNCEINQEEEK